MSKKNYTEQEQEQEETDVRSPAAIHDELVSSKHTINFEALSETDVQIMVYSATRRLAVIDS